ncbi:MAG: hypothetical protein AAEJ04_04610, partial [Planctomycetota bacterium]
MSRSASDLLDSGDLFEGRHIGPRGVEIQEMLASVGADSLDDLIEKTVPSSIRF